MDSAACLTAAGASAGSTTGAGAAFGAESSDGPRDEAEHAGRGASGHGPQARQDVPAHAQQAALPAHVGHHHAQHAAVERHDLCAARELLAHGGRPGGAQQRQRVLGLRPEETGGEVGVAGPLHL